MNLSKIFNYKLTLNISKTRLSKISAFFEKYGMSFVIVVASVISVLAFKFYLDNGLGLAYNDARSHLDIGRRVVEGLKPGLAQLGSVWLPLPHLLMVPTVWHDFMWHSGLAGALPSMISFVATAAIVYEFLKKLGVDILGRLVAVFVLIANINVLYLQSTAMTEFLILGTMTFAAFELVEWHRHDEIFYLIKSAGWTMLATLTRYDGWFLLFWASVLVVIHAYKKYKLEGAEGNFILFGALAGFGVVLWLLWNLMIFGDPLYFAFGPFSAKSQQDQLEAAGVLITKYDWWLSFKFYLYALMYNSGAFAVLLATLGAIVLWLDKTIPKEVRIGTTVLIAPLAFNILALYLGHSVLFIQGLSGDVWFNVRYGIMLMPSIAIFIGYLVHKLKDLRWVFIGLILFTTFFQFSSQDAVTIDDARVGSSQKNVSEVSGWLAQNAADEEGFVLISAASHDAIIFSSGLPMKRFIHEGTGLYWESATGIPDRWAKWIIMRTNDRNDLTYRTLEENALNWEDKYVLVDHFPFADIYELKEEYWKTVNTKPVIQKQR